MTDLDGIRPLLRDMTLEQVARFAATFTDQQAQAIANALQTGTRTLPPLQPHQIPPDDAWDGWLLGGGRGAGKTYAGARWLGELASTVKGLRARIIAPTLSDAVNSVVLDPQSGIIATYPEAQLKTAGPEGTRVEFPNGSKIWCVGTPTLRDVDRLRALTNIDADYFEEAAANPLLAQAVEQAALSRRGNRLPKPLWIATTTPRPLPTIRQWASGGVGETVAVTHATTLDNHFSPEVYRQRAERLKGTRLYRQEVLGQILDDVEGALWSLEDLERSTFHGDRSNLLDQITRVAIGVDPPAENGTCGIVVVGRTPDGHLWVLDDYSLTGVTPNRWALAVATASADYGGLVVAETNQGGKMVREVLRQAAPSLPITEVRASVGKQARAEPIAVLWEADNQAAHLAPPNPDTLTELTDQLTGWVPGAYSPDRLDALVWAATYLLKHSDMTLHTGTRRPDESRRPAFRIRR